MAKLSDEELRQKEDDARAFKKEWLQNNKNGHLTPRMLETALMVAYAEDKVKRMGKVDVAAIAREIVKRIYESPCSTPTPIVETILRSHLEGKSE